MVRRPRWLDSLVLSGVGTQLGRSARTPAFHGWGRPRRRGSSVAGGRRLGRSPSQAPSPLSRRRSATGGWGTRTRTLRTMNRR